MDSLCEVEEDDKRVGRKMPRNICGRSGAAKSAAPPRPFDFAENFGDTGISFATIDQELNLIFAPFLQHVDCALTVAAPY